jgi:hypothetical protein
VLLDISSSESSHEETSMYQDIPNAKGKDHISDEMNWERRKDVYS